MPRRTAAVVLAALIALACRFAWVYRSHYEIYDAVSNASLNPLGGVAVEMKATQTDGVLYIQNESDHYIVFDFMRWPFEVEVLEEDGWHRVLQFKLLWRTTEFVQAHEMFSFDFSWNDLIEGRLRPGMYRVIFYFGDGHVDYPYSVAQEFQID